MKHLSRTGRDLLSLVESFGKKKKKKKQPCTLLKLIVLFLSGQSVSSVSGVHSYQQPKLQVKLFPQLRLSQVRLLLAHNSNKLYN